MVWAKLLFTAIILTQLFTARTFCSPLCTGAGPRRFQQEAAATAAAAAATAPLAAGVSDLAPSSPPVGTQVMQAEERRRRRWRRTSDEGLTRAVGAASMQPHLVDLVRCRVSVRGQSCACFYSRSPVVARKDDVCLTSRLTESSFVSVNWIRG